MNAEELYKSGKMPEMMTHWYSIRTKYPDSFILAYRMGDFYEFFYEDAVNVSKLLGLTLTNRGSGPSRHPLAGIPHRATQHFKSLVKLGQTVIIVEQLEDPKKAKGKIVKRGVVRILSPGTVLEDDLLDSNDSNYLCGVYRERNNFGLAFVDISSGDFYTIEFYGKNAIHMVWSYISRFNPVECILPQSLLADFNFMTQFRENTNLIIKEYSEYGFNHQNAKDNLQKQLKVQNLLGYGIEDMKLAICAAGGLIAFIQETQKEQTLDNLTRIKLIEDSNNMFLDVHTQKNLELIRNQNDGGTFGTLFSILNDTKTPMGTRLLKSWIMQPQLSKKIIEERLDWVQFFVEHFELRGDIRNMLGQMGDLTRLISRVNYSRTANARDIRHIKRGLEIIKEIRTILTPIQNDTIQNMIATLYDFSQLIEEIDDCIHEQPPVTITEGGIIKDGFNTDVDEYRDILKNGKDWILRFEEKEKKKLGVSAGLKIAYNRVLGYYIQITLNALKNVTIPKEYKQRQSLKNAVRYENEELKVMETKILGAEEKLMDLEYEIFQNIRAKVQAQTTQIQNNAETIANIDIYCNFAEIAQNNNYNRPKIENHKKLMIKQGRHPVVEQINTKEKFIPNDALMDTINEQLLIITGPNWSGKSTYLRQVALIVLLAQIGSYIPADSAEIGIVDRIFTRIGASDDLSRGQSTFMLEMNEMAQILHYTSENSLIIIDELGRGTGTIDGESIAQAVIEYLHDKGVKTLFSTHFHNLINLDLPRAHNYHFKIIEKQESRQLIFLRELTDGGTDKSYGIHVAMMAGLPERVTDRAFDLVEDHFNNGGETHTLPKSQKILATSTNVPKSESSAKETITPSIESQKILKPAKSLKKTKSAQTSLFPIQKVEDTELVIQLRSADLDNTTPLQALQLLYKLKKKIT
jgi:DNA mismatch repair protein MutS